MTQTASQALAAATFESDGVTYRLLRLPSNAITAAAGVVAEIGEPFCAMVVDSREVSLILPAAAVENFHARLLEADIADEICKLISIDVVMEPELTGLVAAVSAALADAGIPLLPFASFSRDHLLVMAEHADEALAVLRGLQRQG
ncbi:MAG: ACT domain-containing protein [Anaerolineaceae bacterium]|nr:ACT domain-containing protein [Anaerolineaceae bacterium]